MMYEELEVLKIAIRVADTFDGEQRDALEDLYIVVKELKKRREKIDKTWTDGESG